MAVTMELTLRGAKSAWGPQPHPKKMKSPIILFIISKYSYTVYTDVQLKKANANVNKDINIS